MPNQASLGPILALTALLVTSLATALTALPPVEAFGLSLLGLDDPSGPRWLMICLRAFGATVTPLALLTLAWTVDRHDRLGLKTLPAKGIALALTLAFLVALPALLGLLWSRSFASILALIAIALAVLLAVRGGFPLRFPRPQEDSSVTSGAPAASLWFLALLAATALLRSVTFEEAFGRDQMVYVLVAEQWLQGAALYAEVWDHKPPAGLLIYAGFVWLFGPTPLALYLLGITGFALALLGVFAAARNLAGPAAIYPAGLLWFAFGNDPLLGANQPNFEALIIPTVVWSFVLLTGPTPVTIGRWSLIGVRRAWLLGCLFFLATAFKQIMILLPAALALALLIPALLRRDGTWRGAMGDCLRLLLAGLFGWLATFAAFWATGTLEAFYQAVFAYNQAYAGNPLANVVRGLLILHRSPESYAYTVAAIFFGLLALCRSAAWKPRMIAVFLIAMGLAIFLPGRFYGHYYQLITPILAILGGALCARFNGRAVPLLLAAVASLFVLSSFTRYDPDRLPFLLDATHGLQSLESKRLGELLAAQMPEDAVLYQWGSEPGIYFWSGRPAPIGFVYNYPLLGPDGAALAEDAARDLETLAPDLIVAKKADMLLEEHPVVDWITQHYQPSNAYGSSLVFDLLVPKGR